MHRIRSELISHRTAKGNQIRGLVAEYGLIAPLQLCRLRRVIPEWLEDAENGLSGMFRRLLNGLWDDLQTLDRRIAELDREIQIIAKTHPVAKRLQQLHGVGPIISTALIASVGNGKQFKNGRQMAASLGLTPQQHSSGNKERLLGISKRGDCYLRTMLIHGARSLIHKTKGRDDRLSQWVHGIVKRRHHNIAAVALANKTARIAWAMMSQGTDYVPELAVA
jgi:transposase